MYLLGSCTALLICNVVIDEMYVLRIVTFQARAASRTDLGECLGCGQRCNIFISVAHGVVIRNFNIFLFCLLSVLSLTL